MPKKAKKSTSQDVKDTTVIPLKSYSMKEHGVTQSLLISYLTCRMQAALSLCGWKSEGEDVGVTKFGTVMHWFLSQYYSTGLQIPTYEQYLEHIGRDEHTITTAEADIAFLVSAQFPAYAAYYRTMDRRLNIVEAESSFEVPYMATPQHEVCLRGKRDGLYRDGKGRLWLMEHKSVSNLDEGRKSMQLNFCFQTLFYILATEFDLGEEVAGVLYNIVRRPGNRRGKGTTEAFRKRVVETIKGHEPEYYFARFEVVYTPKQKREFNRRLGRLVMEFKLWLEGLRANGLKATIQNDLACDARWICEYLPMCGECSTEGYKRTNNPFPELDN